MNKKMGLAIVIIMMLVIAACTGTNSANRNGGGGEENLSPDDGGQSPAQDVTLSYWVSMSADAARSLRTYNESMLYQEMEKRTGVKIRFDHPATGSAPEQFNLLIASGNLPDLIEWNFTAYPGGPEKAIADNVIIPLNDLIEEHAPNYKAFLDANPEIRKQVVTDNGTHYVMPAIGVGTRTVSGGLVLRADWLEELSLDVPQTIAEWTHVLRQFKELKGATAPLTLVINDLDVELFNGPFGIGSQFYVDGNTVRYGPYEEQYLPYLQLLNQWYEEGLLDPDFSIQDGRALDAKVLNNQSGAFRTFIGSGMGKYLTSVQDSDSSFDLVAAPYPVMNTGEEPKFINRVFEYRGTGSVAITRSNQNPVESMQWLDYFFSDEGNMLKSFGIEGVTYENDNGYPRYTDLILNNPDGLSVGEAMSKYLRVSHPAVGFVGDDRYNEQYYSFEQQKKAAEVFGQHELNAREVQLPLISATPEEANELATIMAEVNTYRSEAMLQFIMGSLPFEQFDAYRIQLQNMGIERALEIQQNALDRYNARE